MISTPAITYRDWLRKIFALRYATAEPINPASQIKKPLAKGATKRWQGYVALEGFGITRIKNQISEKSPMMGNTHISHGYFLWLIIGLPVFGHLVCVWAECLLLCICWETDFDFLKSIFTPPRISAAASLSTFISLLFIILSAISKRNWNSSGVMCDLKQSGPVPNQSVQAPN